MGEPTQRFTHQLDWNPSVILWAVPVVWALWRARCWTSSLSVLAEGTAALFMHVLARRRWSEGLQNARSQKPKASLRMSPSFGLGAIDILRIAITVSMAKIARACRQVE